MTNRLTRLALAFVVAGVMWGVRHLIPLPGPNVPPLPEGFAPAVPITAGAEPPAPEEAAPQVPGATAKAPSTTPTAKLTQPPRPWILRQIFAPTGGMADEAGGSVASFKQVNVNTNGTRLLTMSERDIICWDATSGRALRTFRRGGQFQTPTFAAPDARTVVVMYRDRKSVVVYDAATAAVVGSYAVKGDFPWFPGGKPTFTPDGSEFIFLEMLPKHLFNVHSVSTRTGGGRMLARGVQLNGPRGVLLAHDLFAVPGGATLLIHLQHDDGGKPPVRFYELDLRGSRARRVPWLADLYRHSNYPGQGIQFTADGRRAMFATPRGVTVGAWPTGAGSFEYKPVGYHVKLCPRLTPDGNHLVVIDAWDGNWKRIWIGSAGPERDPAELQLYDLTTHEKLGVLHEDDFPKPLPTGIAHDLAMSGDGKLLVLMCPDRLRLLDLEKSFGVSLTPTKPAGGAGG